MRILHIADLHLGQTLNGWSRESEHKLWLESIADLIAEREIQALLICGDIFDGINPSGAVSQIFFGWLARLSRDHSGLRVIITSGNHDPINRLEAPGELTEILDIHIRSSLRRAGGEIDVSAHMIPLLDQDGAVEVWVCALPFLRSSDLPGITYRTRGNGSPIVAAARQLHQEVADAAMEIAEGIPIICMGHLHCRGARDEDSNKADRSIIIGGEHALPADVFPEAFSYVALGHIHRAQSLDQGRIRYCGSPFPLSASEIDYVHSVTVVDITRDGRIILEPVVTPRPVEFYRLPDTGMLKIEDLADRLSNLHLDDAIDVELHPFVYVTIEATGPASVLMEEASQILDRFPVRVAGIRVVRRRDPTDITQDQPVQDLSETDPEALFRAAFLQANQVEPEDRHINAFRDVLNPGD